MKYMGSKNRIAKYILPIMLEHRAPEMTWVEPMVGGGNMIDKVEGKRIGADINPHIIDALITIRDCVNELPKDKTEFTEAEYKGLRKSDDYKHKGYAGFAFSYGGKWLGGWRRDKMGKRDYINEAYRNALKQSDKIKDVKLLNYSYRELPLNTDKALIYCDPPYEGTTKYKNDFDHADFWEWCREMSDRGHKVFVSEYNAPDDFECVWEGDLRNGLNVANGNVKKVNREKLFKYKLL